ncbi:MAG: hypothetical protein CMF42_04050 [Legionellales bacterium]|nr:hypothetical protein [Legionellales bacterium]OUX67516.1 MAG: hypothetical protein CBD38_02430 [bacterium TMED178]
MKILQSWILFPLIIVIALLGYLVYDSKAPTHHHVHALTSINKDAFGVPSIKASNTHDAYYTLGYLHATDRLWQMQMFKRTSYGELSELFGEKTQRIDTLMRHFQFKNIAAASFKMQTPRVQAHLNAYAHGVNTRIDEVNKMLYPGLEFMLFPHQIPKWEPYDAIGILKLMSFDLTNKAFQEIQSLMMVKNLNTDQIHDLISHYEGIDPHDIALQFSSDEINKDHGASNVWAIDPTRSSNQISLGAADPHLRLSAPIIWYLVGIDIDHQSIVGATIPGIPAVLIGRNNHLGWGMTNLGADDQDLLYIDKKHPIPAEKVNNVEAIISIKGKKPVTLKFKYTPAGPIISPRSLGIDMFTPDTEFLLQWTALDPHDQSLESMYQVMYSNQIKDAQKKLNLIISPYQNLMIIDQNQLSLSTVGLLPKRKQNHDTQGVFPAAYADRNLWDGLIAFKENPVITNSPNNHFIANTNNQVTNKPYPNNITFIWSDYYRIERIHQLLKNPRLFDIHDMQNMQLDITSVKADHIYKQLISSLSEEYKTTYKEIVQSLIQWHGQMDKTRFEPLFYHLWLRHLEQKLYQPWLHTQWQSVSKISPTLTERILNHQVQSPLWSQHLSDYINLAFIDTVRDLQLKYANILQAQWGDEHQIIQKNIVIDAIPILRNFSQLKSPIDGDGDTLYRTTFMNQKKHPFYSDRSSGLRMLFDMNQPEVKVMISTGQSGDLFSNHYADCFSLWLNGEYISLPLKQAQNNIIETITLSPNPAQ